MSVQVCVYDDGTVGAVKHHQFWDLRGGSQERDTLVSDLMKWNDMISTYSDLVTDRCISQVNPLSILVTYTASLAAFGAVIEHGYSALSKLGDYLKSKNIETERELSREVYKLAKRVIDFVYQLMKLHVFGGLLELEMMKIIKSISTSVEDVLNVIDADRSVEATEDGRLRELKVRESHFLFADALVKIAFHTLGVMAVLSATLVSTETILLMGGVSIVVNLVTKSVTREKVGEESKQAAEKVNRWVLAGKQAEAAA